MSALESLDVVRHLTVIEGGKSRGRPPKPADDMDVRLELAARAAEERAMDDELFPLMQRAKLAARHHGSAEFRLIATIDHILNRHARRWSEPDGAA